MQGRSLVTMLRGMIAAGSTHPLTSRPPAELTPTQMREDLYYLRDVWLPLDQSFSPRQRHLFETIVADAVERASHLSAAEFSLEVTRAVACARNGHTHSAIGDYLQALPFKAWWFEDGLHIVRAHRAFCALVGTRIDRFGGLTAEQALAAVAPFISGTDIRIRNLSPLYLRYIDILRRLGACEGGTVELTIAAPGGGTRVVALGRTPRGDPDSGVSWLPLIPTEARIKGRWPHALDNIAALPPSYQRPTPTSSRWLDDRHAVLYVRCNQLTGSAAAPVQAELLRIVGSEIASARPERIIVDLRLNDGGNLFEGAIFAQALPKLLAKRGRIFVLIGACTFSAALALVAMLKGHGRERVVLVGEPMGDDGHFWADGCRTELPHSRLVVQSAAKYHDWAQVPSDTRLACWGNVVLGHDGIDLQPQVAVPERFSDYAAGYDRALATAIELPLD